MDYHKHLQKSCYARSSFFFHTVQHMSDKLYAQYNKTSIIGLYK